MSQAPNGILLNKGVQSSAAKLMPVGTVMLSKRALLVAVAISSSTDVAPTRIFSILSLRREAPTYLAYWLVANKDIWMRLQTDQLIRVVLQDLFEV